MASLTTIGCWAVAVSPPMGIVEILCRLRRHWPPQTVLPESATEKIKPPGDLLLGDCASLRHQCELTSAAEVWLIKIPAAARPNHLADQFPRLANRLALVWSDVQLADKVLDDLLVDRRGGRRGFPPAVSAELLRLQAFHARRLHQLGKAEVESSEKAWDLQASVDR